MPSIFDDNYDYERGREAGREAGEVQDFLETAASLVTPQTDTVKAYDAGYQDGREERQRS